MTERFLPMWRVEEVGNGFAVQYLSRGEHRTEDRWETIGRYDVANKCVIFTREQAAAIVAALKGGQTETEREACAVVCEQMSHFTAYGDRAENADYAAAIRARSEKP